MSRRKENPSRLGLKIAAAAAVLVCISGISANEIRARSKLVSAAEEGKRIAFSDAQLRKLQISGLAKGQTGSVLNIRKRLIYGEHVWDEEGVPDGEISIRVDLAAQTMSVFRAGHEIGTAVILYGADEKPTPTGSFDVIGKMKDHRSSLYGAPMPYTLRLTDDGISIHGSDIKKGAATHGCVGVPTAFAAKLFEQVRIGGRVVVL